MGLRYNEKSIGPGAQTRRPGPAGEDCAWRQELTGLGFHLPRRHNAKILRAMSQKLVRSLRHLCLSLERSSALTRRAAKKGKKQLLMCSRLWLLHP